MKKFITIAILFTLVLIFSTARAEIYPQTFVVGNVDYEHDIMTLVDCNENEWECYGIEDYNIGDIIAAIMNDNNTEIIFDDEIIDLRYAGYMEGWE